MVTTQIFERITRRTGENTEAVLVQELNLAVQDLWRETDPAGCLQELYVQTAAFPLVTLPPYVYQCKGIRHSMGEQVTLYTSRPYYDDNRGRQYFLEFREMGRTALLRDLSGAGRLKARLNKPNGVPFKVTINGPDASMNNSFATLDFGATDVELETSKAFTHVVEIGKSKPTTTDILFYDVANNLVAILLGEESRCDNIVMRVIDPKVTTVNYTNTVYAILFKCRPPVFIEGQFQSIEDAVALTLIDKVSGEILSRSKDQADQGRARAYEKRALARTEQVTVRDGEAKETPLKLSTSPYYHLYHGTL